MKKGKIIMVITAGIVCFSLAIVMTMQFKIVNETDITAIENMRETELKEELANWNEKYEETEQKYQETIQKINQYKEEQETNNAELIKEELQRAEMAMGKTDVEGQGIIITIRNLDSNDVKAINADDLLLIVEALKVAGAEAISINENRIINMSEIVQIDVNNGSDGYAKVNLNTRISSPYVIKVIGNQSDLESAVLGNGGQVDKLRKIGHEIDIKKPNENIKIEKYNGEIKTKYIVD